MAPMAGNPAIAANSNYQRSLTGLAADLPEGETDYFGPLTAVASGIPSPTYNRVFVFEPPHRDDFATAVTWVAEHHVPFRVTTTESALADVEALADQVGLVRSNDSNPGMVLRSLDDSPSNESEADIIEVTTAEELDEFVTVAATVFGMPLEVSKRVYQTALEANGSQAFLGCVDDKPAACGLLFRSGDVAGVYSIGVAEPFRRQGIGEAMTWAVLRSGQAAGCNAGVLQSSETAVPLYERMGFETVVTYHHFEPAT